MRDVEVEQRRGFGSAEDGVDVGHGHDVVVLHVRERGVVARRGAADALLERVERHEEGGGFLLGLQRAILLHLYRHRRRRSAIPRFHELLALPHALDRALHIAWQQHLVPRNIEALLAHLIARCSKLLLGAEPEAEEHTLLLLDTHARGGPRDRARVLAQRAAHLELVRLLRLRAPSSCLRGRKAGVSLVLPTKPSSLPFITLLLDLLLAFIRFSRLGCRLFFFLGGALVLSRQHAVVSANRHALRNLTPTRTSTLVPHMLSLRGASAPVYPPSPRGARHGGPNQVLQTA